MNSPQIPISWGELLDKITILQIKKENLISKKAWSVSITFQKGIAALSGPLIITIA
jgi:hypothetical protein